MARLDLVALIVDDYDRAIDFFVRVLKFTLIAGLWSKIQDGNPPACP